MRRWRCGRPSKRARAQQAADPVAALKARFARPTFVPNPSGNPPTPAKIALGKRIFEDAELSATGTIACATCHDPKLAFADGEPKGKGVTNRRLARHTPSLWNVAWSPLLFWDGRASSLENQIRFPVEHPDEMGSSLENAVDRFSRHESYVRAFAQAFPRQDPQISPRTISQAVAAYERTLVSPPTRFDRWVAGEAGALTPSEVSGFAVFTGKGRCSNCHTGFAFTDHGFYDIGLPGTDKGRGAEIGLPAADHAFKTPTLRELAWTAPYMHDGSLATLDDVVRHYESGGVARPTRSSDLPANLALTVQERADLVAFLETLSSETPPQPSREPWVNASRARRPRPARRHDGRQPGQQAVFAALHPCQGRPAADRAQRRHPHAQRAHLRSSLRLQLGRAGAPRDRDDPLSRPRHVRGLLRHPPLHAADRGGGITTPRL